MLLGQEQGVNWTVVNAALTALTAVLLALKLYIDVLRDIATRKTLAEKITVSEQHIVEAVKKNGHNPTQE